MSVPPSSRPDTSSVFCASKRSATRGRNCGGIRLRRIPLQLLVGRQRVLPRLRLTGGVGTGVRFVPSYIGRPCTVSGSSWRAAAGRPAAAAAAAAPAACRRRAGGAAATAAPAAARRGLTVKYVAAVAVHRQVVGHAVDDRARVVDELRPQQRPDHARRACRRAPALTP